MTAAASARGAARDFRVVVVRDATSGRYERGNRELMNIGVQLMTASAVAGALHGVADQTTCQVRRRCRPGFRRDASVATLTCHPRCSA
jgi:hypothetical protein